MDPVKLGQGKSGAHSAVPSGSHSCESVAQVRPFRYRAVVAAVRALTSLDGNARFFMEGSGVLPHFSSGPR
jgi:hypothetical protein